MMQEQPKKQCHDSHKTKVLEDSNTFNIIPIKKKFEGQFFYFVLFKQE